MDKTIQDAAWQCLPREVREYVMKMYRSTQLSGLQQTEDVERATRYAEAMEAIFGIHNLSSDAEGEEDEMLYVSRKRVQEFYAKCKEVTKNPYSYPDYSHESALSRMALLDILFGSKCLPDAHEDNFASKDPKPAEPKFKVGDMVVTAERGKNLPLTIKCKTGKHYYAFEEVDYEIHEDYLEPYNEPTDNLISPNSGELKSQESDNQFDTILKDGFRNERRLNIAAMAMQGMLSNTTRFSSYEISDLVRISLNCADALIKKAEGWQSCNIYL